MEKDLLEQRMFLDMKNRQGIPFEDRVKIVDKSGGGVGELEEDEEENMNIYNNMPVKSLNNVVSNVVSDEIGNTTKEVRAADFVVLSTDEGVKKQGFPNTFICTQHVKANTSASNFKGNKKHRVSMFKASQLEKRGEDISSILTEKEEEIEIPPTTAATGTDEVNYARREATEMFSKMTEAERLEAQRYFFISFIFYHQYNPVSYTITYVHK